MQHVILRLDLTPKLSASAPISALYSAVGSADDGGARGFSAMPSIRRPMAKKKESSLLLSCCWKAAGDSGLCALRPNPRR